MFRIVLVFLFLSINTITFGQIIPAERLVNWNISGLDSVNLSISQAININDYNLIGDSTTPNDDNLEQLFNNLLPGVTEVYFPNGTYLFNETVKVPENVIIRGESALNTKLLFDNGGQDHLIVLEGSSTTESNLLFSDAQKNQDSLILEDSILFSIGDHVILSENDSNLVTSNWANNSTGQINQIIEIENNIIYLKSPLRRSFSKEKSAILTKIIPIENVGIENVTIERIDQTVGQTSNIYFRYAKNCWLKCVESIRCNFAHVDIRFSSNIEITGSYFHEAFDYGGGGKGYGVMLHFSTGECLIQNSIFETLRHSMILQAGANGNVFAYNYSFNPFWTGVSLPSNSAGDIVLHGNYPYANLFEGNIVQNIVIDDSHGFNGPNNTFFRNRAETYGIFMNFDPATDSQNFIGNEISNPDIGFYFLNGNDHFEYGNNVVSNINPPGTVNLQLKSLFFDSSLPAYVDESTWPPIGLPNFINGSSIDSKSRFEMDVFLPCSSIPLGSKFLDPDNISIKIFPNPANQYLNIEVNQSLNIKKVDFVSVNGQKILSTTETTNIDISLLPLGLYILHIEFKNNHRTARLFAKY